MSGSGCGWPAPAKINLFLHVTGRRVDGYHLLQSAFQFVDWCDELHFNVNASGEIGLTRPLPGVPQAQDLCVRAAQALRAHAPSRVGVEITVDKRLPMGGGIGGGSSDAATTLVALNHLWGVGLDPDQLAAIGLSLGADVPVFVRGVAAFAEGVGEQLTPVLPPEPWYLLLVPGCAVPTAEIFAAPDLTRHCAPIKIADFLAGQGANVCEPVVRNRYPEVGEALDWLARHAEPRMSGTGATVYAAFASREAAESVARQAPARWQAVPAVGLNRSPLVERLRRAQTAG